MKKSLRLLCFLLCLGSSAVLGQEEQRFKPGELDLSPFATYVDKAGDDWGLELP